MIFQDNSLVLQPSDVYLFLKVLLFFWFLPKMMVFLIYMHLIKNLGYYKNKFK